MYLFHNPNPKKTCIDDNVIRAISILTNQSWHYTYMELVVQGYDSQNMPSATEVWEAYLKTEGYEKHFLKCHSVKDFCKEHPKGRYLVATSNYVIPVINGSYHDVWDCGDEVPIYYFTKEVSHESLSSSKSVPSIPIYD